LVSHQSELDQPAPDPFSPEMDDTALIDGTRIAYTLTGRGPTIVLLHGWMCNRSFWKEQVRLLSENYQVMALDFRGHGGSAVPADDYSIQRLVEDVHRLSKSLAIDQLILVGHSMGGMVAQQFCIEHPQRVLALILVTTIAADVDDRLISKRIATEACQAGFRTAFLQYFDGWFGQETAPEVKLWVRDQMLRTPEVVGLSLVASYQHFDLRTFLPSICIPTLVICGGSDASAVPNESRALVDLIPGAEMLFLEGCGHFPMLEMPQTFNQAIADFLSAQDNL
jgi:pimeloyl-ACP methyl ester carboxylesterase